MSTKMPHFSDVDGVILHFVVNHMNGAIKVGSVYSDSHGFQSIKGLFGGEIISVSITH